MGKVDIGDLGIEIMNTLQTELKEIQSSMDVSAIRLAKELAEDIRTDSPKDSGEYANGWYAKKKYHGAIVHNTKKPELTQLLEYGHNSRNGKRVSGKPHILKNAERIEERFYNDCVDIVTEGVRYNK